MSLIIHTHDLVKVYRNRTVVNKVSVNVKQGEIVGLLGPNGAGKTTSFYMVVGLIKPDEGEVYLNEEKITSLPMYKRAQMGIGYLPQEASVFRKLTVEDNIMSVLEMTNLSRKDRKDKVEELLNEFRLTHVRKNNGDSLSGGERRRTEIARALAPYRRQDLQAWHCRRTCRRRAGTPPLSRPQLRAEAEGLSARGSEE